MQTAYVPRRDATDYATRAVDNFVNGVLVLRDGLTLEVANLRKLLALAADPHHLTHRVGERLALLHGHRLREFVRLRLDECGELHEAGRAFLERGDRPGLERLGGSIDGSVEILAGAVRDVVEDLAGRGVDHLPRHEDLSVFV